MQDSGDSITPPEETAAEISPPPDQKTVLYVGDLDPQVTESELSDVFHKNGCDISSVRLCKDASTGKSLSYAYVNFTSHDDAATALQWMNYTRLREKPMRLMWSQRDPHVRKTGVGNLFVKNIEPSISTTRVRCIFGSYGTVLSCKVVVDDSGKSKGYGFVQYESEDSAMAAVKALHDTMIEGKKLYVSKFVKKSERKGVGEEKEAQFTNVYVKNLPKELTTEEELTKMFAELGKVTSVLLVKDNAGKPKGFGFVNYEKPEDAKNAIDKLNGQTTHFGSQSLFVGKAQKKSERGQVLRHRDANLYVKNIEKSVDEEALKNYFSKCGSVASVKVVRDDNGESKGFGFVSFFTPDEAKNAISTLNGTVMGGRRITVAVALRKEERAAAVAAAQRRICYGTSGGFVVRPPELGGGGLPVQRYVFPSYTQPFYDPYMYRHLYGAAETAEAFYPIPPQICPQTLSRYTMQCYGGGGYGGEVVGGSITGGSQLKEGVATKRRNSNNNINRGSGGEKKMGDNLYEMVHKLEPERAATVTRMLMDMNKGELKKAMSSPNYLAAKVRTAVHVIENSPFSNSSRPLPPPPSSTLL